MKQTIKIIQTYLIWLFDMVTISLSYQIATSIRFSERADWGDKTLHYMVLLLFLLFATIYNFFVDWNRDFLVRGYYREIAEVLKSNILMMIVGLVFVFFMQWANILSRLVIGFFLLISVATMFVTHVFVKWILQKILKGEGVITKLYVVSQEEYLEDTIKRLSDNRGVNFEIVGSTTVNPDNIDTLTERLIQTPFDEVFINTPDISQRRMATVVNGFEKMGVVCHYNLELPDVGQATSKVDMIGDFTVISYTMFRSSYKRLMIKRLIDIIGGLVGVILTAFLTIFIGIAIKLDSKGPIFFSQTRVGKNGRRFKIYKFRSMSNDAEKQKAALMQQNEMDGLMFKMENDPRITRVGHFLRKTSLDEFPQFLNVLKGDMSLVGTRPPTEEEFEEYNEHYRRRLSMTPGLTGLWQISGRNEITDFDEVVKLDLRYIDNWSLSLDFKIILQTVGVVLFGKGAR